MCIKPLMTHQFCFQVSPTCPIHLVYFNQLESVLHGHLLPLLIQQEVQQVSGTHLTLCLSVRPINLIYLLPVRQLIVELLDLCTLQGA